VLRVPADFEQLGEETRPHILRSHINDFLVDSFVAEFSSGGHFQVAADSLEDDTAANSRRNGLFPAPPLKYGGVPGVGLAERLFINSSEWCLRGQLSSLRTRYERALLGIEILNRSISLAFPGSASTYCASHQRKWSSHLRTLVTGKTALMSLVEEIRENINDVQPDGYPPIVGFADEIASEIHATLSAAEKLNVQRTHDHLIIDYPHENEQAWISTRRRVPLGCDGRGIIATA